MSLTLQSTYRMHSGWEMPVLGFGVRERPHGNVTDEQVYQTPARDCEAIVLHALRTGYRHIDSATVYRNEQPCAAAMRASGIPRAELFFTTKIPPYKLGYAETQQHVAKSLQTTGLEYLDCVLIHAPFGGPEARNGTWRALREAQRAGTVRSIGVSNYGLHHLEELDACMAAEGGRIDVGQWELHPWLMRPEIVAWCRERGVVVQAWGPLVRAQRFGAPTLAALAKQYGRTEAQVLVRWSLQQGFVPLPKSVHAPRVEENASVFGWELSGEDVQALATTEYSPCSWDPTTSP